MRIVVGETKAASTSCEHVQHTPVFNAEACRFLSPEQVRARYPRYEGMCQTCTLIIRMYADLAHFIAGGWDKEPNPAPSPTDLGDY